MSFDDSLLQILRPVGFGAALPSLLQHSIGLNQEERATLRLQAAWELLVDFYQTAFPMAFICYGIKDHIRHMANNPHYPLEQVHTVPR